ncbi:MAG TPA: transcriptional regulator [Flavobacteriales bacterium]|jgi:DNA-binding transcriptional MerR regulator|nr:transcriptional regulator [Crocinitomicaceae bacterium]MEC8113591.1 MerR family transcriptional regulator [Bacteroidota bacterium]MEE2837348.1 MerR family transcriptional regulator [Bacteroidota bacterium]HCC63663.1 transcriptional regulator [Flavobacteriales bacterium]
MPLNQPIQKRYHSISEVAKMLDVNPSLLRFWEKQFKQIQPKTNARGKRAYRQEDIDVIRRIYDLVKVQGLTLEGARKAMSARKGEAKERGAQAASAARAASAVATPAVDPAEVAKREEAVSRLKKVRQRLLEARAVVQS